jgi:UDP-3-O-[3-hydroxymyristoyl] glucosamine N-acyltransferase
LTIGDGAVLGAQAAAANSIEAGAQVLGYPAMDRKLWTRVIAASKRLPELIKAVRRIEKKLGIERERED